MKWVAACNAPGMFSIGKTNPERRKAGSRVATMANWLATNWLLPTMLISMPRLSATIRKLSDSPSSSSRLPRNGTTKT